VTICTCHHQPCARIDFAAGRHDETVAGRRPAPRLGQFKLSVEWLLFARPLPPNAQAAAQAKGHERYEGFLKTLGWRLQRILQSIEGPVTKVIAVIAIITTGLSLAFGDAGGGFRRLI
jgi:type IV secretory pathway VirB2 component (pilin)